MIDYTKKLEKLFDVLWPLNRSITGDGVRQTHHEISKIISIKTSEIHSGKKVYDWKTPKEWELVSAELFTEKGKLILSTKEDNISNEILIKEKIENNL